MANHLVKFGHFLLKNEFVYDQYQRSVGGVSYRKRIVKDLLDFEKTAFLDLGCGTSTICSMLPGNLSYYGIDNSLNYLKRARRKFPKHSFIEADLGTKDWYKKVKITGSVVSTGLGLLHHLDDNQAKHFLLGCRSLLSRDSLLFTVDPIICANTTNIAKWFANNDRGEYVRTEKQMYFLFTDNGFKPTLKIRKNQFNVPLDTIEITATIN